MRLETAVANWIRAEWVFRSSPEAYRGETQEWFEKACADLREALTGAGDLDIAAHTVGLPKKNIAIRRCPGCG